MWMPERVWEQSFTRDLVDAGIEYTMLDDFHFKCAGLTESQLTGHLLTEDDGRVLSVFPGSERLRYTIPFAAPQQTIDYLAKMAEEHPNAVAVFGDDGEKFGTWPETKKHVYDDGWLARFFDALVQNQDWIQVTTLAEAFDNVPPVGQDLSARLQLPRDDRMGAARRAAGRVRADRPRDAATIRDWPSLRPLRARRLLAELQGEVSRSRRDVLPHDDRQPPAAGDARRWAVERRD